MSIKTIDFQEAHLHFVELATLVAEGNEVILTKNRLPFIRLLPFVAKADTSNLLPILAESDDMELTDWLRLSQIGLSDAYDDDEPEYSLDMIKEPNPVYAGR